jgi:DNA-binding winged helix-turn-helix (wHTH) protein/TolB-like protein
MVSRFDGFSFDPDDGRLSHLASGESVTVRPQVGSLLEAFLDQPGAVLDREHLCQAVWDENTVVDFESGLAALIRELRQALKGLGGSADLIETVPRRGYRLRVDAVDQRSIPNLDVDPVVEKGRIGRWWVFGVPVILVGLVLLWFWLDRDPDPADPAHVASSPTLAILPFDVIGPPDQSPDASRRLQLLLADGLLAGLWQADLDGLVLIGRAAVRPYEGRNDLAAAVAEDLGVDLLVEGSLSSVDGLSWQVDARLLAMPGGSVLWSDQVEWDQAAQSSATEPARALVSSLADQWSGLRERRIPNPELR